MRHFFIIVSVVLFASSIHSQDTTYNNYYYPYYGVTNIYKLLSINDNYYGLIGQMTLNYKQNYGILKFDKSGNLIDSNIFYVNNKYRGTDKMHGHGFIHTTDSCFLYCGGIKDTAGWVNGFLAKFDKNMDTIWTKEFYHPDTTASLQHPSTSVVHLSDIKETPEGNYIVTGNYNKNAIHNEDRSFLMKLDTAGNIIWYKLNPNNIKLIYDIEIDPLDSGFYFPSMMNLSMPKHVSLFKVDKFGDLEWSTQTNHSQIPNYPHYPMDVELINDSIAIMVSSKATLAKNSVIIAKVNTQNNYLLWEKEFAFSNTRIDLTLKQSIGIHLTNKGNIIISATIIPPKNVDGETRATLLLINQNGDSLWQRYYAHNWDDTSNVRLQLNDLLVCDDGGFLFGGFASVAGMVFSNSWLVKTDSLGMTKAAFTLGIEEKNTLVIKKQKPVLYPNPVTTNFNLRFEQSPNEDLQLNIYSASGALVKQQRLNAFGNEYKIDIRELSMGVYFIKLMSGEHIILNSKFIKQ